MNTNITLSMLAMNAPAFKAEETMESLKIPEPVKAELTMEDIAPKAPTKPESDSANDTMQAIARELPKEEPQVNYLYELYAAQERRKQNPQPEVKRTEGFDPLSVLAGVQR